MSGFDPSSIDWSDPIEANRQLKLQLARLEAAQGQGGDPATGAAAAAAAQPEAYEDSEGDYDYGDGKGGTGGAGGGYAARLDYDPRYIDEGQGGDRCARPPSTQPRSPPGASAAPLPRPRVAPQRAGPPPSRAQRQAARPRADAAVRPRLPRPPLARPPPRPALRFRVLRPALCDRDQTCAISGLMIAVGGCGGGDSQPATGRVGYEGST